MILYILGAAVVAIALLIGAKISGFSGEFEGEDTLLLLGIAVIWPLFLFCVVIIGVVQALTYLINLFLKD